MSRINQFDNTVDTQVLEQPDLADENARLDEVNPEYKGETIEVNGVERTVYNSNGERIAKSEPALRNFWNWFGASQVVDDKGRPLVVYHGTDAEFDEFDLTRGRANMDIQGAFFSPWEIDSGGYGANVRSFYLKIENPATEQMGYKILNKYKGQNNAGMKARDELVSLGYDGVNNGGEEYIVLGNPELANIRQTIEQVLVMEPVSALTGQEFQKDGTPLTTKANDYYKENYNNEVYRDGVGTVKLDKRAIKDSAAHGIGKEKVAAFQAVPEVIKNGLIFDEQTQWKGRNYDSVSFIAPITINGERYTCEVIVKKSVEQNRFYLHEVEIEKNLADVFKTSLNTGTPASSRLSIAKKWEQVKTTSQIKSTQNRGTFSKDTGNIYHQRTQANGYYDAELKVIVLGRNMNTMTLPCNFFAG